MERLRAKKRLTDFQTLSLRAMWPAVCAIIGQSQLRRILLPNLLPDN